MAVPNEIDAAPEPGGAAGVNPPATPPASAPRFKTIFAVIVAALGVLLAAITLLVSGTLSSNLGLSTADWESLTGAGRLAARMTVPLTFLGVCITLLGLWMAVVEWRGTFVESGPVRSRGGGDLNSMIDSIGKLRGAALVMVVGALLMLGSIYVAGSFANPADKSNGTSTSTGS